MEPQQLKQAIEWAKKNPNDPRAKELRRRIESGKLNAELKQAGMKTFEVKPKIDTSKIDMSKFTGPSVSQRLQTAQPVPEKVEQSSIGPFATGVFGEGSAEELKGDIRETAKSIGSQFMDAGRDIVDTAKRDDRSFAEKAVMIGGRAFGGGSAAFGELITGIGKMGLTQEAENQVADIIQKAAEGVAETELAQDALAWYNNLDENDRDMVDAAGGFAAFLTEVVGLKGAGKIKQVGTKALDEAAPVIKEGVEQTAEFVGDLPRQAGEALDTFNEARRPARIAAQQEKVTEAVGRITQAGADKRTIEQAQRALSEIDTTGVKTYEELNIAINDKITALSRAVDSELDKYPNRLSADELTKTTDVGGQAVKQNPVENALDGLIEAYTKSGDAPDAVRIKQLKDKMQSEGLTLKEVNQIAREYGIEFKERAFTKMGDPKAGFNAENFENVRKGVKEVLRDKMPDDVTKELDRKISDLYSTRQLTTKIEDKVSKLQQRIKNRTLAQKVGGAAASIADLATFGTLRGFVARIMPSNMGNKAMNSLEIEAELQKNLKEINKLLEIQDEAKFTKAFEEWAENIQPGMSIRSTVQPDKIAKAMDKQDFNNIVRIIDEPSRRLDHEEMIKGMGLQNATDDELVSFLKDVVDEYEGVAERTVTTSQ